MDYHNRNILNNNKEEESLSRTDYDFKLKF